MLDKDTILKWAYEDAPTRILRALCRAWVHSDLLQQNAGQYRAGILEPAIKDAIAATDAKPCTWIHDEFDDSWDGTCGVKFTIHEGMPEENGMHYCPKCGKQLLVLEEE